MLISIGIALICAGIAILRMPRPVNRAEQA
jgi:hypothetical protein